MTTIAHTLSASIIALTATHTPPTQTSSVLLALATPTLLDFDHLIMIMKNRQFFAKNGLVNQLHHARSIFHEVPGVIFASLVYLFLKFTLPQYSDIFIISYLAHLTQDLIIGKSFPYNPINHDQMQFFRLSNKSRVLIDISVILVSLFLWKIYLKGLT